MKFFILVIVTFSSISGFACSRDSFKAFMKSALEGKGLEDSYLRLIAERRKLVEKFVARGGALDRWLENQGLDPMTAEISLFESSVDGKSFDPHMPREFIKKNTSIDIFISASSKGGELWSQAMNERTKVYFEDIPFELVAEVQKGGLDVDIFRKTGIEVERPDEKRSFSDAIIIRSPRTSFVNFKEEPGIFKGIDLGELRYFLIHSGKFFETNGHKRLIEERRKNNDRLYIVLSSLNDIVVTKEEQLLVSGLRHGTFGEFSLMDSSLLTTATVGVGNRSFIVSVPREAFLELIKQFPEVEKNVYKKMSSILSL